MACSLARPSDRVEIEIELLFGAKFREIFHFLALCAQQVFDQLRVKDAARQGALFKGFDRVGPSGGQLRQLLIIGDAGDRGRRRQLVFDTYKADPRTAAKNK